MFTAFVCMVGEVVELLGSNSTSCGYSVRAGASVLGSVVSPSVIVEGRTVASVVGAVWAPSEWADAPSETCVLWGIVITSPHVTFFGRSEGRSALGVDVSSHSGANCMVSGMEGSSAKTLTLL